MFGVVIDNFLIPGLVEDIQWGEWDRMAQYTTQFGLMGSTVLQGGRTIRQFVCPMVIFGDYDDFYQFDAFLQSIDDKIGKVGKFEQYDLGGAMRRTFEDVELLSCPVRFTRWDPMLKNYARADVVFRQLRPADNPAP